MEPTDAGAANLENLQKRLMAAGFRSYSPKFCISDANLEEEVGKIQKFVAIKEGLEGEASKESVEAFFAGLLKKYPALGKGANGGDYADACMTKIVEAEKRTIQNCLDYLSSEKSEKLSDESKNVREEL